MAQFPSVPDRIASAGSELFQSNLSAAAFGNPANGDSIGGAKFLLYSTQTFLLNELTETGIAFAFLLPGATQFTAGYATRGFDLYRKHNAVLSLSKQFGAVSAGIRTAYIGTQFGEGYPGEHRWRITPGTRIRFGRQLEMIASMDVPIHRLQDARMEEARLGCIHHFSSRFSAGIEAVQTGNGLRLAGAIRYRPGERTEFFGGLSGREVVWSFGCSVLVKGVRVLVAASHTPWLGFSPGLSVESSMIRP